MMEIVFFLLQKYLSFFDLGDAVHQGSLFALQVR